METVILAALAIGGSTLIGTGCGFLFNRVTPAWSGAVTSFAAGVMLAAAAFGLFVPAMEMTSGWGMLLLLLGTACGALLIRLAGGVSGAIRGGAGLFQLHPELLFVLAIIVHKLPEGMAGGIGLNGMDPAAARTVVIGIALQNLPEGVVMIPPLLNAGLSRGRAACIALATGLLNGLGVVVGALWGRMAQGMLPFILAFAGGAMLDVILTQMIPQAAQSGRLRCGTLVALGGFAIMACINTLC